MAESIKARLIVDLRAKIGERASALQQIALGSARPLLVLSHPVILRDVCQMVSH